MNTTDLAAVFICQRIEPRHSHWLEFKTVRDRPRGICVDTLTGLAQVAFAFV